MYSNGVVYRPRLCTYFTYCVVQIPPPPPKPDFDEPRAKLTRLREGEDGMSKEQYTKMKQELEAYVRLPLCCCDGISSMILVLVNHRICGRGECGDW